MRLSVETQALKRALATAMMPIRKMGMPVLECVQIVAKDNTLRVIGSDMEVEAQARCDAAVAEPGTVVVNAARLNACAQSAPERTASLSLGDDDLVWSCGSAEARLRLSAEEFPRKPKPEAGVEVVGFGEALEFCAPFVGGLTDWNGALHFSQGHCVAGTSNRLAFVEIEDCPEGSLTAKHADMARRVRGRLFLSDRQWRAEAENTVLIGPLTTNRIADRWPSIVAAGVGLLSFEADDMLSAVQAATLSDAVEVFVEVAQDSARVSGERFAGPASASSELRCDGRDAAVLLNAADLSRMCAAFAGAVAEASVNQQGICFRAHGKPGAGVTLARIRDRREALPSLEVAA